MIFLFFLIVSISTQAQDLCSISSSYVFENKDPMAVELTLKKQWVDREAVLSLQQRLLRSATLPLAQRGELRGEETQHRPAVLVLGS